MDSAGARFVGNRLLGEVEEESLEELLASLRTTISNIRTTGTANTGGHEEGAYDYHHTHTHTNNPQNAANNPSHQFKAHQQRQQSKLSDLSTHIPIPALQALAHRYHTATKSVPPPFLSVSGRYMPFLYHLVSLLLSPDQGFTVAVVDADGRFDVTRLISTSSGAREGEEEGGGGGEGRGDGAGGARRGTTTTTTTEDDLKHVYIFTPPHNSGASGSSARGDDDGDDDEKKGKKKKKKEKEKEKKNKANNNRNKPQALLDQVRQYMLYAPHKSRHRKWWGTIVINPSSSSSFSPYSLSSSTSASTGVGGTGAAPELIAGWKGWLRVEREHHEQAFFPPDISAEEALAEREQREQRRRRQRSQMNGDGGSGGRWVARCAWGGYTWDD